MCDTVRQILVAKPACFASPHRCTSFEGALDEAEAHKQFQQEPDNLQTSINLVRKCLRKLKASGNSGRRDRGFIGICNHQNQGSVFHDHKIGDKKTDLDPTSLAPKMLYNLNCSIGIFQKKFRRRIPN